MARFSFNIDVPVRSEWANVDLLVTSIRNCFAAMFADVDGCHTIAMVTGELLENAVKYGDWSRGENVFRLLVSGTDNKAHISVQNPVGPDTTALQELLRTLKWLESFPSADEAYRARLLEVAAAPPHTAATSKLGLVRIAYEANCVLRAEQEDQSVRVTADLVL